MPLKGASRAVGADRRLADARLIDPLENVADDGFQNYRQQTTSLQFLEWGTAPVIRPREHDPADAPAIKPAFVLCFQHTPTRCTQSADILRLAEARTLPWALSYSSC